MIDLLEPQNHPKSSAMKACIHPCKTHEESRKMKVDIQGDIRPALIQWESSTLARAVQKSDISYGFDWHKYWGLEHSWISCAIMCRLWSHLVMSYVFTAWVCFILFVEYRSIAAMRLKFLSDEKRRPDQFTVSFHVFVELDTVYTLAQILYT